MPSKSPAQARLMQAAAHNPGFAKKAGVPQGVAEEFVEADKAQPMPADRAHRLAQALRATAKKT